MLAVKGSVVYCFVFQLWALTAKGGHLFLGWTIKPLLTVPSLGFSKREYWENSQVANALRL